MPIRFPCQECGRLLSIARRKAGATIECPKCGYAQVVPEIRSEPDASAAASPGTPQSVGAPISPSAADRFPSDAILISRRALYSQGALLTVIAIAALAIGYAMGRGSASAESDGDQEPAPASRVLIEGKLLYRLGDRIAGDEGAVAIFLPQDREPARRIDTPGIRPEDAPPPGYSSLRKIRELGGVYVRADGAGEFSAVLPRAGDYYVLLISAATQRSSRDDVDQFDLEDLNRYFRRPEYLLDRQKYRLTRETLSGFARIEHDFGPTRRR